MSTISHAQLERYERIAADTNKEFFYSQHTGHWCWADKGDEPSAWHKGFSTRLNALLDAIDPVLSELDEEDTTDTGVLGELTPDADEAREEDDSDDETPVHDEHAHSEDEENPRT